LGEFAPCYDEKQTQTLEADTLIVAIGQAADLSFLDKSSINVDRAIKVNPVSLATLVPGIFAGGDVINSSNTVIDALASGRKAAVSIDRCLKGDSLEMDRENENSFESQLIIDVTNVQKQASLKTRKLSLDKRSASWQEVDLGFTRIESEKEASRCLACNCRICINSLGCPAMISDGKELILTVPSAPAADCAPRFVPPNRLFKKKAHKKYFQRFTPVFKYLYSLSSRLIAYFGSR
jgi:hypothetical protein